MVGQLLIHLGDHKTGSTAIQAVLAERRFGIEGADLHYSCRGLNNNAMVEPMMGLPAPPERYAKMFARRAADLDASPADYGVLSAEHLENVEPGLLMQALETHMPQYLDRLRLIVYVRPHADRFVSSFVERSKLGLIEATMEQFLNRARRQGMLDYAPRIARWQAVFGDRLTVRAFVRDRLRDGDVVADFFDWAVEGRPVRLDPGLRRNESLSLEDLAMLIHMQGRIGAALDSQPGQTAAIRRAIGWNLAPLLNDRPGPVRTPVRLHRPLAERLVRIFRADAEEMDRRFFIGAPMTAAIDAAPGKAVDTAQSLAAADHFDAAGLRLIEVWTELLLRMIRFDPQTFPRTIRDLANRPDARPARGDAGGAD